MNLTNVQLLQLPAAALVAALSTGAWRGGGDNMAALLAGGGGALGLLHGACLLRTWPVDALTHTLAPVFVDDMTTPVLSVPLSNASFLRNGTTGTDAGKVYIGLTASTGAVWQAVDILSWNLTN